MFKIIPQFKKEIASFFKSRYSVVSDNCTYTVALCLPHKNVVFTAYLLNTYTSSMPFTFEKLGINRKFKNQGILPITGVCHD